MERNLTCNTCGCLMDCGEVYYIEDIPLCRECFNNRTAECECCGRRIWREDNAGDNFSYLCQSCYNSYYSTCDHCGIVVHQDDLYSDEDGDYSYCHDCWVEINRYQIIHDYSYKPDPIFYGNKDRFMGVELEIDQGGCDKHTAKTLLDLANQKEPLIYIKTDGSLDNGFEIVTHPMTLDYHQNYMPWEALCRKALSLGYYSHKTGTSGLHVHVNRNSFGNTKLEQEDVISRILHFVETFWNEMLCFSRRTESQMNRWAARYGRKETPKQTLYHAKNNALGRYACVNLTNRNTIEFRMFRGTLKYNTIIATLQMVDEICSVAVSMSDSEMDKLSWSSFVSKISYPELIAYLKERNLYINDPVECEEEY